MPGKRFMIQQERAVPRVRIGGSTAFGSCTRICDHSSAEIASAL